MTDLTPAQLREQRDIAVTALHDITQIAETYDRDYARDAMGRVNKVGDIALARIAEVDEARTRAAAFISGSITITPPDPLVWLASPCLHPDRCLWIGDGEPE